ncbi:hypothetical protein E9993_14730 [Labilibacter sediminis]|nr:hypothetical protein E9993_14730 [Labilibacter sediminis]
MTLIKLNKVVMVSKEEGASNDVPSLNVANGDSAFVHSDKKLHQVIGTIKQGETKHYWSRGTFNSVRLLLHVVKQIGACDVVMSTYSISEKSARQLWNAQQAGLIGEIRFIIDNRVRSMSPKPFQALLGMFPDKVRTASIHAKVTTIKNADWSISIVSSMNATDNNKIERGLISTDRAVFEFDNQVLNEEFKRGAN